jgi:hypothetical protein
MSDRKNWIDRFWLAIVLFLFLLPLIARALIGPPQPTTASPGVVTLAWSPSLSDTNPANPLNYLIEFGTTASNYTQWQNFGTNLTGMISGLTNGLTWYFVAVAQDTNTGFVSPYSGQVSWTAPVPPMPPRLNSLSVQQQ